MDVKEYKRKFDFIIDNSKDVDIRWFDEKGYIVWVDDMQIDKKNRKTYCGILASDMKGTIYTYLCENCLISFDPEACMKGKWLSQSNFEWIFKHVSVYSLLWRVNRIYDELEKKRYIDYHLNS